MHADDYPSWPGRPGPYALHPDHPSWPGRPDPRWADTEAALRADNDYPSWPERTAPLRLPDRPAPPRHERPAPPRQDFPAPPRPVRPVSPQPARQAPPGPGGRTPPWPDAGPPAPDRGQRFQAAPTAPVLPARARSDLAPRAYPPPPQPVIRGRVAEVIDRTRPPAPPTRPQPARTWQQPAQTWQQPAPVPPEPVQVWDAGSVQLATWIISEANQHAADIRHEARDEAATSLAGAKQEASQLMRQATDQAAATLAAAELAAAEIRANVTKLTAELGGVASYVTRSLYTPTAPAISPESMPQIAPLAEPVPEAEPGPELPVVKKPLTKTETRPGTSSGTRPAVTHGTRSAAQPKSRQHGAFRVMTVITATLVAFALVAGTAEVAMHGFSFFVFRATGTGETGPNGLQENQGPGQPDAPKLSPIHIHQAQ
jgi:hypothetical protein